jgi:hypothetical protein
MPKCCQGKYVLGMRPEEKPSYTSDENNCTQEREGAENSEALISLEEKTRASEERRL